jgi:uncharacterized Tic20 family protein
MWAMWCHLSAFAGFVVPLGSIFGPLIVWLTKRDQYPMVYDQGKEALNFQISVAIYAIALFFFTFIGSIILIGVIGVPILLALGIFWVVMVIMAGIRANEGQAFRYPLTIRFIT